MGPIQHTIKWYVAQMGYGPWYQREAWEHVRYWPANTDNATRVFEYLQARWPNIKEG